MNALYVDRYCMTMAQSFWRHDQNEMVSFELFVRSLPANRDFLLAAGIGPALSYLQKYCVTKTDIEYLRSENAYDEPFLKYLKDIRFTGEVVAVPEGTVTGPGEPILRVTAPRIEATLIESALLTMINHETMVASKAARIIGAAKGRPVIDFSLRRLHGYSASIGTARAAYIAGCAATATLEAGRILGIPTSGTMAHHFVQRFGPAREVEAFSQFLSDYPDNGILLVDTYNVERGVDNAIRAGKATGIQPKGLRLDSGDLTAISMMARAKLDAAGFQETQIVASNDLDEYRIKKLIDARAPIDAFGVGTRLGTGSGEPVETGAGSSGSSLGGVFKLIEQSVDGKLQPVMKMSAEKSTDPGIHQIFRVDEGDRIVDTISLAEEKLEGEMLLMPALNDGVYSPNYPLALPEIREYAAEQLKMITGRSVQVERSASLQSLAAEITRESEALIN